MVGLRVFHGGSCGGRGKLSPRNVIGGSRSPATQFIPISKSPGPEFSAGASCPQPEMAEEIEASDCGEECPSSHNEVGGHHFLHYLEWDMAPYLGDSSRGAGRRVS